jgi:hypothetical protein
LTKHFTYVIIKLSFVQKRGKRPNLFSLNQKPT